MTGLPSTGLPPFGEPSRLRPIVGGGRVRARLEYRRQVRLGRPGRCADRPTHIYGLIDSSGSVTGGNDPIGQRFLEFNLAIDKVASKCRCGEERVSVFHFDHPVQNDLVAANLTDSERIQEALRTPYDGGGCSMMASSLTSATRVARAHPDHRNVLVALTDFELFDPPTIWEDFLSFPGEVYACVLGGRFTGFDGMTEVSVTKVDRTSPPGAVAQAVFNALVAERSRKR